MTKKKKTEEEYINSKRFWKGVKSLPSVAHFVHFDGFFNLRNKSLPILGLTMALRRVKTRDLGE
jgi:hypothetical protein